MPLELVDHRADAAVKQSWTPFPSSEDYEHPDWWSSASGAVGDPWFVQVLENGTEVARVQFDDPGGISPHYARVPTVGGERLEIQHIEVAAAARRRKVATRVVRALVNRHPDRRLFAYSGDADGFWGFLGWEPFYDSRPGPAGRTLFIQPNPEGLRKCAARLRPRQL
ncbi:GNAT family N-acetyltransferase [Mycobacterium hodleri]|uniref:GNAT family N-acetyltransferase n=1 Tax=Mycolicibacterium hodleri TaxID=49897 RepID=A0A544VWD2_9MYCO|nr:GNAT family N-acetyltransferase [Mycolicibacterium hodleri]TQR84295.1 GNAT family N-acetyltransferase [Mycolicibacterium hodleri]